jgi:hypothetical protein
MGRVGTSACYFWDYKLVYSLLKTVQSFLKKTENRIMIHP